MPPTSEQPCTNDVLMNISSIEWIAFLIFFKQHKLANLCHKIDSKCGIFDWKIETFDHFFFDYMHVKTSRKECVLFGAIEEAAYLLGSVASMAYEYKKVYDVLQGHDTMPKWH